MTKSSYALALAPCGDHLCVADFVAGAVGAKLFVEAEVEAVLGAVGDGLPDHFAREFEVGEDLVEGKRAAVGGELLVDVLDAGFVCDRKAGAAAAGDAAELEEAQLVPERDVR